MIIDYTPEGGETLRLDAGRLRASEIQVIERTADRRWAEIQEAMSEGDINALRTVAWVIRKRSEPSLRFGDFDPFEDELRALLDARETRAYAEKIFARWGDSPEDLPLAWDELRESTADPEACEAAIADVTAPKDPAPAQVSESSASPSDG
ncbi:hypothetical protein ACFVGN_05565 [Streptomyces sp. NPDC057757]|uniref:hypothetical protein n=1 Tax=Streptomyces sp. NPDC057757 TaxID=3346241 RepID=UPI003677CFBE